MTQKITAIFGIAVLAAVLLGGLTLSQSAFAGQIGGGGQEKVTLCHVDRDGERRTITVGAPAVPAHLAHGDTLGPCVDGPGTCQEQCDAEFDACLDECGDFGTDGSNETCEGFCEFFHEECLINCVPT